MDTTDVDNLQTFEMLNQLGLFSKVTTWRDGKIHIIKVKSHLARSDDEPVNFLAKSSDSFEQAKADWVKSFKLGFPPEYIFELIDYMKAGVMTDVIFREYYDVDGNRCLKMKYFQPHIGRFSHRDLGFDVPPLERRENFYKNILDEIKTQYDHYLEKNGAEIQKCAIDSSTTGFGKNMTMEAIMLLPSDERDKILQQYSAKFTIIPPTLKIN